MRRIFIIFCIFCMAVTASAKYVFIGQVFDEKNAPLVGATVRIQNLSQGQTTNQEGKFKIEDATKNRSTIEISFLGYETEVLDAVANKNLVVNLKQKAFSVNEITVTSLRATDKSAVAYTNVSNKQLEKRNLGEDIPYLLSTTPSFVATSDAGTGIGYTGFRIRGSDANRINITINDVPVNDAESHGTFFVNLPDFASSLSSVQVQRGVGTSTNGAAAFGASINMETQTLNAKPYSEIGSSYGSFNTNKNMLKVGTGLMDNHMSYDIRLSNITSDGYIDRASVNMKSYYFSGGYFTDKTVLKFLTFGGNEKTYQAWNGVSVDSLKTNRTYNELGAYKDSNGNIKFYDNQTDNYNQTHYQLHWLQELNDHLDLNLTAHLTRGIGYYEEYKTDRSYVEYGLTTAVIGTDTLTETDLVRQKWLDNYFYGLTYSLNYNSTKINASFGGAANRYDGDHYGKAIWVRNAQNLDIDKEWYRSNSIKDDANFYAKANAEVVNKLFVSADLQYRYINYKMKGTNDKYDDVNNVMRDIAQEHSFNFFNPKFGLTYKANQRNDVYASYSIANREPNRNNYTDAGENEKPISERLFDSELGYRHQSSKFSAGANLYYMKYKNQLILTGKISEIGELLTSNVPDSYRSGIELTLGAKITTWLKWDGNLTLSENKILNFTEEAVDIYDADWNWIGSQDNYLGKTDIAYSPNIVANSIFTFNIKAFECGIYSAYVGKQYIDNTSDNNRSIDPYFVNNLSLKYSLKLKQLKEIAFQVLVNNVFNEQYVSNGYTWYSYYVDGERNNDLRFFPQAGTNALASITLKF